MNLWYRLRFQGWIRHNGPILRRKSIHFSTPVWVQGSQLNLGPQERSMTISMLVMTRRTEIRRPVRWWPSKSHLLVWLYTRSQYCRLKTVCNELQELKSELQAVKLYLEALDKYNQQMRVLLKCLLEKVTPEVELRTPDTPMFQQNATSAGQGRGILRNRNGRFWSLVRRTRLSIVKMACQHLTVSLPSASFSYL